MKYKFLILLILIAFQTRINAQNNFVPNQVLVKLADVNVNATNLDCNILDKLGDVQTQIWSVPDTLAVDGEQYIGEIAIAYYLTSLEEIVYAEPNYLMTFNETPEETLPNDSDYGEQWGLNQINAEEAWVDQTGKKEVVVSILDTGVDWKHEDLVDNIWQNLGEDIDGDGTVLVFNGTEWVFDPDDENGIDDDGNGYADDFVGWNFYSNNNNPMDDSGHGTHVAGIIGATGNNDIGVTGVVWNTQLMPIKFIENSMGSVSAAIKGLEYAVANNVRISNNSWGNCFYSYFLEKAIEKAQEQNHIFVASAGNETSTCPERDNDLVPAYPASFELDNIIAVANLDTITGVDETSHYGATSVDLAAPGINIYSTLPNDEYGMMSGTSMSTAFVTGAVALLLSECPDLSTETLIATLLTGIEPLDVLDGLCTTGGQLKVDEPLFDIIESGFSCDGTTPPETGDCTTTVPSIEWQQTYGGSGNDFLKSVTNTNDGGFIFAGLTMSSDGDLAGNYDSNDWWIVKTDSLGNIEWSQNYGNSAGGIGGYLKRIQPTNDGGFILGGSMINLEDNLDGIYAFLDYWLIKIDALGNIIWEKAYGGSENDWFASILQTPDNGFMLVGNSHSNDGDVTVDIDPVYDFGWIVKVDSFGNLEWEQSYDDDGIGADIKEIIKTNDDNFVFVGNFDDALGNTLEPVITKIDPLGNVIWEKNYGESQKAFFGDVVQTNDGGFMVTGYVSLPNEENSSDPSDFIENARVIKMDNLGNIEWQQIYGDGDYNNYVFREIQKTNDDEFFITGYVNYIGYGQGYYESEALMLKIDAMGNIIWSDIRGNGEEAHQFNTVKETLEGELIVGGIKDGDFWAVKLDNPCNDNDNGNCFDDTQSLDLGPDQSIVVGNGSTITITNNITNAATTFWYYNGQEIATTENSINVGMLGTYIVIVNDECGNSMTDTLNIVEFIPDNVWPGDMNTDNVVNHIDVLYWGLDFNKTGPMRENATTDWIGQAATDWDELDANNINDKHSDADGNGIVNQDDLLVIDQNYGYSIGVPIGNSLYPSDVNMSFVPNVTTSSISDGIIVMDIFLEENATDIHGVAWSIQLEEGALNNASFEYENEWFGEENTNVESFYHYDALQNKIFISITRTDGQNISGSGKVGRLIVEEDGVSPWGPEEELELSIENGLMLDTEGEEYSFENTALVSLSSLNTPQLINSGLSVTLPSAGVLPNSSNSNIKNGPNTFDFSSIFNDDVIDILNGAFGSIDSLGGGKRDEDFANIQTKLYPNPTTGTIFIESNEWIGEQATIYIYDTKGKECQVQIIENTSTTIKLNLSYLPEGMYMAVIQSNKKFRTHKFIKY